MRLNIFSNLVAKYPQETNLDDIVRIMRNSEKLHSLCHQRVKLIANGKKEEAELIKKKQIPAFAPCAYMIDGKSRNHVIGLTDLCFLEIDHITEEQIQTAKGILSKDEHVMLALRSISGDGLHFLIRYGFYDMEQPSYGNTRRGRMNYIYGAVFKTLKTTYQEALGVRIDSSGANMERLCLISADKDLYYNPNALPVIFLYEKEKIRKSPMILTIRN